MPRPSRQIDQALLGSGRVLFPQYGCAGLSLRQVAEHAGVNVGMFHYHFRTKDNFLRTLLQQMYEEMFARLSHEAAQDGSPLRRLRLALVAMARFARAHRALVARVWMDVMAGEPVACAFFRDNAPRHLGLLFGLLEQADRAGELRACPPVQRFAFLMGALMLPMIFVAGLVEARVAPTMLQHAFDDQVMSDAAIEQRVDLALAAIVAQPAPVGATGRVRGRARRSAPT